MKPVMLFDLMTETNFSPDWSENGLDDLKVLMEIGLNEIRKVMLHSEMWV